MDALLLQLADSTFPSGGFAHSAGLEAARNAGLVPDEEGLRLVLGQQLLQTLHQQLPFTRAVHDDPVVFELLDQRHDELLAGNHIARTASRTMGQGLLASAAAAFPDSDLKDWKRTVRRGKLPSHVATVQGLVGQATGLDRDATQVWALHGVLRDQLAAAVRLSLIGPMRAQAVHRDLAADFDDLLATYGAIAVDDACSVNPLIDLVQANHDQAWSRLFQS